MRRQRRGATPPEWTNTRVMDAEAFLDVACATPIGRVEWHSSSSPLGDIDQVPSPVDSEAVSQGEAYTQNADANQDPFALPTASLELPSIWVVLLFFFVHVVMHSLVVPFVCTFAMIPLLIPETPYEIWQSYYWLTTCGVALYFSENAARCSLGFRMSGRSMLLASVLCAAMIFPVSLTFFKRTYLEGFMGFAAVMFALYTPPICRIIEFIRKGHPLRPLLWFISYMTWGASPTVISVALYYGLIALEWKNDIWKVAGCVALWSVVPFFVKAIGWKLVYRGSPKDKFVAPVLWILYCDLAFGTLGLPLFMHGPRASLTYAASVGPVLLLHLARGAGWLSWCRVCRDRNSSAAERRVTQLSALLEALCAVQGRAVAYTVYFTMMALKAAFGAMGGETKERYSLMQGSIDTVSNSVQIYRHTSATGLDILAACCGLLLSWGSFCFFCWMLPDIWATSSQVVPVDASSPNAADASATDRRGWMLGGDRVQTLCRQYQVIITFFQQHLHNVVSMLAFQLAITVAAVNMAELIIHINA